GDGQLRCRRGVLGNRLVGAAASRRRGALRRQRRRQEQGLGNTKPALDHASGDGAPCAPRTVLMARRRFSIHLPGTTVNGARTETPHTNTEVEDMPTWVYILIALAAATAVLIACASILVSRRSHRLRSTFSSEYDRAVTETGGKRRAERELLDREKRRDTLEITPLSAAARDRYAERWLQTQTDFVDSPDTAVRNANALVEAVMSERGYPIANFEEQAAVISVDHADVVEKYRSA